MSNDLDIITALVKLEKETNELDKTICKYKDKEIKRLQKRIDKAIEYIENVAMDNNRYLTAEEGKILYILRGEDSE